MQNSANVVRMAGGNPSIRKRFFQSLPVVGDAANFLMYLYPDFFNSGFSKPPTEQDVRNAVIIGGGGLAASLATGGLDAVPAVIEFAGDVGKSLGLPKTDAEPVFQAAPLLNIENYLREYAYSMDPETNIPESEDKLRRYKEFVGIN